MPVPAAKDAKTVSKPSAKAPAKKASKPKGNVGARASKKAYTPSDHAARLKADVPAPSDDMAWADVEDIAAPPETVQNESTNLPAIQVQESQVPGLLTMREAAQMGVAVITANSQIARQITASAKSSDLDGLGKGLTSLMVAAQEYDPSKLSKWSFVRFWKKKQAVVQSRVNSIDENVSAVINECDRQVRLMDQRIGNLEGLYEENEKLYHSLGVEIEKAEARIAEAEALLPAVDPEDTHSIQDRSRAESAIIFAKKRVEDLRSAKALSLLQGPQIQLMAENCYNVIQSFGTLKETTIPTLQRQYAAYVVQSETGKAVAFAENVRAQTNDALVANAKSLHANTVKSNEALGKSLVTVETLQLVHQELMSSIADVSRIRTEMVARLKADAPRIEQMNTQINRSLMLTHSPSA